MKRSYGTIALLLVLVAGLFVYFTVVKGKGSTSLDKDEIAFAVKDTAAIGKIVITQRKRNAVFPAAILSRTATGWHINGKPALEPNVRILLETMFHLSVRQTMKEAGNEAARTMLEENHIRVQTYNRKGELIKDYRLGSEINDGKGSICLLDGASTPYVVEMPGLTGVVNTRFTTDELFWRENLLFDGTLSRLSSVQFSYKDAAKSFKVAKNGTTWAVEGVKADTALLNAWLKLFKGKIYAEQYAGKFFPTRKQELEARLPDLTVTLAYADGGQRRFVLYYMDSSRDRYWAWVEGEGELLTVQQFVFEPFMRDRAWFTGKK